MTVVEATRLSISASVSVSLLALPACSGGDTAGGGVKTLPPVPQDPRELPVRLIENVPENAEAYYAPDSVHVISQTKDPIAQRRVNGDMSPLTYTFTDTGEELKRINDLGQDACAFFFPDGKRLVWTSTRDNLFMPIGNWSDSMNYPQGSELYVSDLDGRKVFRLTDNDWYDAEVSVSPDGEWIVFGRQKEGMMDLWRIRPDGSDEQQITFTEDLEEGAPFYLPDNETILYRAWSRQDVLNKVRPRPMTVYTIKHDGTDRVQRTFSNDMNWAPYPAPDGRHYVFVRITDGNWDVWLGDLAGGEPRRLTWYEGFDGFPSLSPDGSKMLFARGLTESTRRNLFTHVMDVSPLGIGPENYQGVPDITPPAGSAQARLSD